MLFQTILYTLDNLDDIENILKSSCKKRLHSHPQMNLDYNKKMCNNNNNNIFLKKRKI